METLAAADPRQIGSYRLRARLGAGGMGQVFLGYSPAGRAVAVKVIHRELARDPEFRTRFRREVPRPARSAGPTPRRWSPPGSMAIHCGWPRRSLPDLPWPRRSRRGALTGGVGLAAGRRPGRGAAGRPFLRAGPPGPEAGQHAAGPGRPAGHRFRDLPRAGEDGDDLHRDHRRHPRVHVPRASRGRRVGPPSDVFSLGCVLVFAATSAARSATARRRRCCTGSCTPRRLFPGCPTGCGTRGGMPGQGACRPSRAGRAGGGDRRSSRS